MKNLSVIFLLTIFIFSCSNDNEEDFFSNNDCETEDINYLPLVQEIIESKCISCHVQGNSSGLPVLDSYANVTKDIDNIIFRITTNNDNLIMPPLGATPLTDCEISQIQNWYENEMPL